MRRGDSTPLPWVLSARSSRGNSFMCAVHDADVDASGGHQADKEPHDPPPKPMNAMRRRGCTRGHRRTVPHPARLAISGQRILRPCIFRSARVRAWRKRRPLARRPSRRAGSRSTRRWRASRTPASQLSPEDYSLIPQRLGRIDPEARSAGRKRRGEGDRVDDEEDRWRTSARARRSPFLPSWACCRESLMML